MLRCSRLMLSSLAVVLLLAGCATQRQREAEDQPLNFVLIIVDDLGWKDTSVYGTEFYETPNIDQLAMKGMRFTQFYTAGWEGRPLRRT